MKNILARMVLAVAVLLLLSACQATTGYYRTALAKPETVVPLSTETTEMQQWQDLYVDIKYTIRNAGGQQLIEGSWEFAGYPQTMMVRVRDFKLKFFLLDQQNRVLDYFDLAWVTGSQLKRTMEFRQAFSAPEGTVAASFGYEGSFIDEDGGGEWAEKLPRTAP